MNCESDVLPKQIEAIRPSRCMGAYVCVATGKCGRYRPVKAAHRSDLQEFAARCLAGILLGWAHIVSMASTRSKSSISKESHFDSSIRQQLYLDESVRSCCQSSGTNCRFASLQKDRRTRSTAPLQKDR